MPLPQLVQPLLDSLSEQLGESSSVSILDGTDIVYVARAAQKKVMSISLMPGSRLPAYCTSMGRVLLAALPEAAAGEILSRAPLTARTSHTLTDPEALVAEFARVRLQGQGEKLAIIIGIAEMGERQQAASRGSSVKPRCDGNLRYRLPRTFGREGLDDGQAFGQSAHDVAFRERHRFTSTHTHLCE